MKTWARFLLHVFLAISLAAGAWARSASIDPIDRVSVVGQDLEQTTPTHSHHATPLTQNANATTAHSCFDDTPTPERSKDIHGLCGPHCLAMVGTRWGGFEATERLTSIFATPHLPLLTWRNFSLERPPMVNEIALS